MFSCLYYLFCLDWHDGQPSLDGEEDCVVFAEYFNYEWGDFGCTEGDVYPICEMS